MSDAPDIAALTPRSPDVCPRIHAADTEPSRKIDAAQGWHRRAAAKGRIALAHSELFATIARFLADVSGEAELSWASKRPSAIVTSDADLPPPTCRQS
jgi:hypothetical protein